MSFTSIRTLIVGFAALAIFVSAQADAGEGGKRRRERDREERQAGEAQLGDPIGFAIKKSKELALNAQQVEYLKQLKKQMQAERAKDKEEESMKEIFMESREARKKDPQAARVQRQMYHALAEQQGKKWEERELKELEKVLPKDKFTKLKELRGEEMPEVENPFDEK
jgi:hypothetical protein